MELGQQVCNLELARKLKELGVNQESLFYWSRNKATDMEYRLGEFLGVYQPWQTEDTDHAFSAFTVAELGEILPPQCIEGEHITAGKWKIDSFEADTEADARAKMLIYLLENKLINI